MAEVSRPTLLTSEEAAEMLGTSVITLANWRCTARYSLPFVKIGRSIRYKESDLLKFIESRTVTA